MDHDFFHEKEFTPQKNPFARLLNSIIKIIQYNILRPNFWMTYWTVKKKSKTAMIWHFPENGVMLIKGCVETDP